jgi:hypothetical protein
MAESELAGNDTFDALATLLRDIRKRAEKNDDRETVRDADKADVLLRDFGVATAEESLLLKKKLKYLMEMVLPKAAVALQGNYKAHSELDGITSDAMVSVTTVLEKLEQ